MAKKMVINTEKFLEFLDDCIKRTYQEEMKANSSEHPCRDNYLDAYNAAKDRDTFEWIKLTITGEQDTDLGEFMEEADCRDEAMDPIVEDGNIICPACGKNLGLMSLTKKFCKECGQRLRGRS